MRNKFNKKVSLLLVCVLVAGMLPGTAWAEESGEGYKVGDWFSYIVKNVKGAFDWENSQNDKGDQDTELELDSNNQLSADYEELKTTAVEGDYEYATVNGSVTITRYKGTGGDVIIPEILGGNPVTSIGATAFSEILSLTSVSIPDSVTSIGFYAFYYCKKLRSVSIPSSVTSIGQQSFQKCSALTSVSIPDSVASIGRYAFLECSGLTSVSISGSVTSIEEGAFSYCSSLSSVSIPDGVSSIGDYAFASCNGLTSVSIPGSVSSIGNYAFKGCGGLTSMSIPDSVSSIGDYAFNECFRLTSVRIPDGVNIIGNAVFRGCNGLTSVSIPNSVTSIGAWAFAYCNITSINIPNSVTSIGEDAFRGCNGLTDVIIPDSVTSIGAWAFYDCTNLKTIQFDSKTTEFITDFFVSQTTIPSTATIIGYDPSTAKDYASKYGNPFQLIKNGASEDSTSIIQLNSMGIVVKDFDTKQPLKGADVNFNGKIISTNENGLAAINSTEEISDLLTVTSTGYCDYQTNLSFKRGKAECYYLRKDDDVSRPYVTMVNLNDGNKMVDVLRDEKEYLELSNEDAIKELDQSTVAMKANWKGKTPVKYMLTQDGSVIMESNTGTFDKKPMGKLFKAGKPIFAVVEASDGTRSKEVRTNIIIYSKKTNWNLQGENGELLLNLGENIEVPVPEDLPIVGGRSLLSKIVTPSILNYKNNQFKIAIGLTSEAVFDDKDFWSVYKSIIDNTNDPVECAANIKKIKENYSTEVTTVGLSTDWSPQIDGFGYIEGYVKNGKPVITDGAIMFDGGMSYSQSIPLGGYVPVYWEIGRGFNLEFNGQISEINPESGEMKFDIPEFIFADKFETGVGVGYAAGPIKTLNVGIYGGLDLNHLYRFADQYSETSLSGEVSTKVTAMCFSAKKVLIDCTEPLVLWSMPTSKKSTNMDMTQTVDTETFNIFDISQYSLMPRDYAKNPTSWNGNGGIAVQSDDDRQAMKVLQSNIYPDAQPLLTVVGDKQVLIWLADNVNRTSANRTMLVYSVYDKNNDTWSEPVAISDDGTADFYPAIGCDGNSLYVAWQNSKTTFSDNVSLTDVASAGEITVSKFDPSMNTFMGTKDLTNNEILDTQPQIAVDGSNVGVVWTENDQNDIFGIAGRNSVIISEIKGDAFTQSRNILDNQNIIASMTADYVNGKLTSILCLDGDNDLNTINDRDLYVLNPDQQEVRLTNNAALDSSPVFGNLNGMDTLFWYSEGNIAYVPATDLTQAPKTVFLQKREGFVDSFSIVNNANGKAAVIWIQTQDEANEIYGSVYVDGEWSNGVQISDADSRIQFPSGIFDTAGNFNIAFNRLNSSISMAEQSDLCLLNIIPDSNLTVGAPFYENEKVQPNTNLPVEIDVTNKGVLAIEQISVEVLDGDIVNNTQVLMETIKPGETKTITVVVKLPDTITRKDYAIKVLPTNGEDMNLSDNEITIGTGYTDLSLDIEKYNLGDENVVVAALVTNKSATPTDATIRVTEDTPEGKELLSKSLTGITQEANQFATINLNLKDLIGDSEVKAIYVSIVASEDEKINGDNKDFIVLDQLKSTTDVRGDVDGNGEIQAYDALMALQIATGKKIGTAAEIKAADVDNSGIIQAYDALRILQYATGKIQAF